MKLYLRRMLLAIVILAAAYGSYKWVSQRQVAAQATSAAAEAAKVWDCGIEKIHWFRSLAPKRSSCQAARASRYDRKALLKYQA